MPDDNRPPFQFDDVERDQLLRKGLTRAAIIEIEALVEDTRRQQAVPRKRPATKELRRLYAYSRDLLDLYQKLEPEERAWLDQRTGGLRSVMINIVLPLEAEFFLFDLLSSQTRPVDQDRWDFMRRVGLILMRAGVGLTKTDTGALGSTLKIALGAAGLRPPVDAKAIATRTAEMVGQYQELDEEHAWYEARCASEDQDPHG